MQNKVFDWNDSGTSCMLVCYSTNVITVRSLCFYTTFFFMDMFVCGVRVEYPYNYYQNDILRNQVFFFF